MNFSIFILPGIFVGMAFIITKKNAKYLLSGYNTMSAADREKVDLDGYLRLFKRFHIFLGFSLLAITLLMRFISPNLTEIFTVVYPIGAYGFFIFKSNHFFNPTNFQKGFSRVVSGVLAVGALVIVYFLVISFKETEVKIQGNQLELTGIYGIKIDKKNITDIRLIDQMPRISSRTNGFNGGSYRKGNFRMSDGSRAKLFINQNTKSYLLLKTRSGDVYYSSEDADMAAQYQRIRAWAGMPNS